MILDAAAAARLLGLAEEDVYKLAARGLLPSHSLRDQLCFNRLELLEWAQAQRRKVDTSVFRRPHDRVVQISSVLAKGGIHRGIVAKDAREATSALVRLLPLPATVERETIERLFEGGVAGVVGSGGIAVPHARSPIVLPADEPILCLAFFEKPVDLGASDGVPVFAAFALLSPTVRAHLHVLSRLAGKLSDPTFQELLRARAPDDAILARLRALEAEGEGRTAP